jgi:uncharacterized OsmC-like protein
MNADELRRGRALSRSSTRSIRIRAVGFQRIRLAFHLTTDASDEQLATSIRLTERYCVVYQTLRRSPEISVSRHTMR